MKKEVHVNFLTDLQKGIPTPRSASILAYVWM